MFNDQATFLVSTFTVISAIIFVHYIGIPIIVNLRFRSCAIQIVEFYKWKKENLNLIRGIASLKLIGIKMEIKKDQDIDTLVLKAINKTLHFTYRYPIAQCNVCLMKRLNEIKEEINDGNDLKKYSIWWGRH